MNKNILVSILLVASVLVLATAMISAYSITPNDGGVTNLANADTVDIKVNGISVVEDGVLSLDNHEFSVIAGETISVKVAFRASNLSTDESASNVRIRAELEGNKADVIAVTPLFDVEEGKTYVKSLTLKVPTDYLDEDELSGDLILNLKIWNSDKKTEVEGIVLNVQKPSYELAIKSIIVDNSVDAGEKLPVEVVLKNVGYNDADDVYVTVSIPELNIEKQGYFGDIFALENHDEDEYNTISGKLYLNIPYTANGVYTLVVSVENDEVTSTAEKTITIKNNVSDVVIKSGNDLILLNPTNKLVVYTVKYNANEATYAVSAGSSKNVAIEVPTGDYNFDVVVYSGAAVVGTVNFSGIAQPSEVQLTNPVFVLTVILAVVFLVLLVVLVVLITKKPQKTEEFGESYY